jgi:predicted short-subunit dehydrogenase-like oxidoreductase (DUF2520 family)
MKISILGTGRAGTSFYDAFRSVGHEVQLLTHHDIDSIDEPDVILLCVPDDYIAHVAALIPQSDDYVVAHVAGSRTLDVLHPHRRTGSMHPLATLPSRTRGSEHLRAAVYCVSGDDVLVTLASSLGGRIITLRDDERTLYHATASVASNHLVALMGHVERLANAAGLRFEDFLDLSRQALEDVSELGPERALTGPASRGDMATIDKHLASLPEDERSTYVALSHAAFVLAEQSSTSNA